MPRQRCRICGREFEYRSIAAHRFYPFCSERCRLLDLGAWFQEKYRLRAEGGGEAGKEGKDER